jgi:tetratricopeptide (TPR) repeat protein
MSTEPSDPLVETGAPSNPFPGLRPFEFDESHLFFGRDGQSEEVIGKLGRRRFLALVGTSGSGKSSLVRAGLLPTLLGGFMTSAGSDWRIAMMRPGNNPIRNLANALNAGDVFGSEIEENAAIQTAIAEAALRRGSLGLVDAVRQAAMPENETLLVVVDQFEEIFRFDRVSEGDTYRNESSAFVKLILEASRQREIPIYVVLTMRSDYLGDCSRFWDLPEAINESQYLIPRLTRDQLREVITGPVAVGAGEITQRLVNRLLNDVGDNQDQLPVMQHLLMRVWDECKEKRLEIELIEGTEKTRVPHRDLHKGEAIDLCCYEAVGGMAEALSRHADEAYEELTESRRKLAEQIFRCLTERGPDNREVRRPMTVRDICAVTEADETEVIAVVETFRRPGRSFLMPPAGTPLTPDSLIDISHESLIRNWKRLQEWVDDEARCARTYRRLAETAVLYRTGEAALWRDPDLQTALNWRDRIEPNQAWARRYHPAFEAAIDFLEKSTKQQIEEIAEREREQRERLEQAEALAEARRRQLEAEVRSASRLRRRAWLLAVAVLVALLFAVGAVIGYQSAVSAYRRAEVEKATADEQRRLAEQAARAFKLSFEIFENQYKEKIDTDNPKKAKQKLESLEETLGTLDELLGVYRQDRNSVGEGMILNTIAGFHRFIAESYSVIGVDEHPQSYFEKSQEYFKTSQEYYHQALEILNPALGANHPEVATSLTGIATIFTDQGKYIDSEPLLNQSLEILAKAYKPDDPYLADAIMNLAECYNSQGKYDQAEPLYKRALEIRRNRLGENHADFAESSYGLGWINFERGKYAAAEPLFKQALAIWDNEPDKRDAATALDALSLIYRATGNLAEAERYLDRAWEIHSHFTNRDRLSIAYHLENVGLLHGDQGKPDAETYFKTAVTIWTQSLGRNHPARAFGLSNLASFYHKHARYAEAEKLFNEALTIQQALLFSPDLARTLYGLARLHTDQGKYNEAEPLFLQALAIQEKAIPDHPDYAGTLDGYAHLLDKTDRPGAAGETRNRAERVRQIHREENSGAR